MLKLIWNLLGKILYPETCCACGKFGSYLCTKCRLHVDFLFSPIELPENSELASLTAAFHYKPPISSLIQAMKYRSVEDIGKILGELLYLHTNFPDAEVVTSVPLLREKKNVRGFNQAKTLAVSFAKLAKIPYQELLQKHSHRAKSQASTKDLHARLTNVERHAFTLLPRARPPNSVLIVDDVFTTGATLNACARPLKAAGVKKVHGLVVAHGR